MTQDQIHQLFKHGYNQNSWKQFIGATFSKARLLATPEILTGIDSNVASKALRLGYITLDEEGIDRLIAVYQVTLAKGIVLERNRVGLRNLLRKYWKNIDAAFIVYHNVDNSKWRFTYVSELTGYDASGEFIKIKTEPKRYTYLLGEGESTRTAAERFALIAKKANKATLDDVKDAFSVEKLSKAFFDEYKEHYDIFCDFMVKKPNIRQAIFNGDEKAIRDFNKKLLGRIVFLYFIQKKGWMGVPVSSKWGQGDFNFLTYLFNQQKNPDLFYSETLSKLFFDTLNTKRKNDIIELVKGQPCRIPYLNGGLFEEDDKKHRNIILNAKLFENLFNFFNQYNFTIYEDDPNDHTVAVDPEMLGHIFENLLEDNKDKGAYYTPKEIVHYMCQESLIEYLSTYFESKGYEVTGYIGYDKPQEPRLFSINEGRKGQMVIETSSKNQGRQIDRSLIEKLLNKRLDESDKKLVKKHAAEFHNALDNVKIVDPAIGSGAYPMGLLQEIFTAKQTLYHFEHGNLIGFQASDVKLNIIQKSIYGVDIEKGAVDIARLRFWLSLVVDEDEPKALPNLDYKIVVGNSLVSKLGEEIVEIDWSLNETSHGLFGAELAEQKSELLKKISKEQAEFFNPNSDKKKLTADIRRLKIALLINQLELMIKTKGIETKPSSAGRSITKQTELYLQTLGWKNLVKQLKQLNEQPKKELNFFDWKLDFPEVLNPKLAKSNYGFDIVIANPPYIKEYTNRNAFDGFRESAYYQGKMDVWYGFACKMLDLLKEKGVECFIAQNNWITSAGASIFRDKVLSDSEIKLFTDFGNYKVFETAGIQTMIYLLKKKQPDISYEIKYSVLQDDNIERRQLIEFLNFKNENTFSKKFTVFFQPTNSMGKTFTFNDDTDGELLMRVNGKSNFKLLDNEIAQGIVPNPDVVNSRNIKLLKGKDIKVGNGVFVVPFNFFKNLNKTERKYIKPIFEPNEISRYTLVKDFDKEIIYISKANYQNDAPTLLAHLKKYKPIMDARRENQNGRLEYFHLHWPRDERFFREGEKILSVRKCSEPTFLYTTEPTYVMMSFNIITSERINLKYLTALLNSRLVAYWLRNKGKMQGNNYQIDKEPLLEIPIYKPTEKIQNSFEKIVTKILSAKESEKNTSALEAQIDNLIYRMYELKYEEVKTIDPEFTLSRKDYEAIEIA